MRQFHELFVGRTDAYGTYALPKGQTAKRGTKFLGKAQTIRNGNLTVENYREHVRGEVGLGIVPIIPKVNTVSWFVIDVDKYGEDDLHGSLAKMINALNLPLVVCKSKSGGAHLYCFLTEPAPAADVLGVARKFAKKLKLDPKVEIFPKQDSISSNDAGSWINLPYFGETRPCMGADGHTELTLKEFVLFVHEREVDPSDLDVRVSEMDHRVDDHGSKAPPCIDRFIEDGIEEGGRDNALTHVSVYMKKRYPDDWQDRVAEFNASHITPELKFNEVSRIIKGAERRDYQYLCKQQPMCAVCDKDACLKREFGVGSGEGSTLDDFTIDSLRKIETEDPIWVIVIDGIPISLKTDIIFNYPAFRMEFFKRCNRVLKAMKPEDWKAIINEAADKCEVERAPAIVGESGQIRHHFMEWVGQALRGSDPNMILDGNPIYREKELSFRGTDFISYLKRTGGRYEDRMVWQVMNEDGAETTSEEIKGTKRQLWTYPVGEPWFDLPDTGDKF